MHADISSRTDRGFLPSCLIVYFLLEENCGGKTQQSHNVSHKQIHFLLQTLFHSRAIHLKFLLAQGRKRFLLQD